MNCARCQHSNVPGARFCGQCATPLPPASYTPPHLAARIRANGTALEGERRRITVLFADLAGSTALVEGHDPEEASAEIDPVLAQMMEAVHRYEGTVNQVMGDGIMALFGAPLAHEDHALRACYAALRMQDTVARFAAAQPARGRRIRVGMDSGEVLVRNIAADLHMEYTPIGQTTHVAARMQQMAEPGAILATVDVMRLVEGYVDARPKGSQQAKGLNQPVEVYEVTGATSVRTRVELAVHRGLAPFVGRGAERAQLERAAGLARTGQGQAVQIAGDPGVGKSRLLWEFIGASRSRGWSVLESSAISHRRTTAYFPILELLSRHFRIQAGEAPQAVRERLRRALGARAELLPALAALFDLPSSDPSWESLDPPQRHHRTVEAVKTVLLQPARAQPVILTFEDLHYIDAESQDVLDSIVKALPGTRTLLLVEHRPEYSPGWGGLSYCTPLRLEPLAEAEARELFRGLAGEDRSLAPLERRLLGRTEGNALFLEESLRALAQRGALEGAPGRYRLVRPLETIEIPAMVQDVLAARLDLLPAQDKALLQLAAVIGRHASLDVLARVAGLPEAGLEATLERLQAGEFLLQTILFPDLNYTFKHAFTHEITYGSLPLQLRRRLHGEILDAMEALYAGQLGERVELLAHHAVHGERWPRAIPYLARAAARAYERSAFRDAVRHLDLAIRAVARLPPGAETLQLAIDLRLELRNSLLALGSLDRMAAALREAEPLADALGDEVRSARVAAHLTGYFWLIGQHRQAVEAGSRTLGVAAGRAEPAIAVPTRFYLAAARHSMGEYREAIELLEQNVAALRALPPGERFGMAGLPVVFSRAWLAWSRAELGDFAAAGADAEEAQRAAQASGQPFSVLTATFAAAIVHMARGAVAEALRLLEQGLAVGRAERLPLWVPPFASQLGLALARGARPSEAVTLLEQALPAPSDAAAFTPFAAAALAEAYLLAGRVEDAAAQAERALERARRRGERGYEAWALMLLGEIATRREPPDPRAADACFRDALARADELGMRPLAARCQSGLGGLQAARA